MDLFEIIDSLCENYRAEDAVMLALQAASGLDLSESLGIRPAAEADQDRLLTFAIQIRGLAARERLRQINDIIVRITQNRTGGMFWMAAAPALQLAALVGTAESVRVSFGYGMHPALLLALDAAERGAGPRVRFIDRSRQVCALAEIIAVILEIEIEVIVGDPLERQDRGMFEVELCLTPLGERRADIGDLSRSALKLLGASPEDRNIGGEALAVAEIMVHANRAIVVTSTAPLFRSVGVEVQMRISLIDSGRLSALIALPTGGIYPNTNIATNVLVLDAPGVKHTSVRMVDASAAPFVHQPSRGRVEIAQTPIWSKLLLEKAPDEKFAIDVPVSEIAGNNWIMTINRYFHKGPVRIIQKFYESHQGLLATLDQVADIVRPQMIRPSDDGDILVREAAPSDITERGYLRRPAREVRTDAAAFRRLKDQQLKSGDVLISTKGRIAEVAIVPDGLPVGNGDEIWTAGQSLVVLRPNQNISSICLYQFLSNEVIREYLRSLAGGANIPMISMSELKGVTIAVCSPEEQARVEAEFAERQALYDKLAELRETAAHMRQESWPNLRMEA